MTKSEFEDKLFEEFSQSELALIDTNIPYNRSIENHNDYWLFLSGGKYDKCYEYLIKNRHLLKIKDKSKKFKMSRLKKEYPDAWINKDIAIFKKLYPNNSNKFLSEKFNVSDSSIVKKARRLKI